MFKLIVIILTLLIVVGCGNDAIVIDEDLPTTTHFAISDDVGDHNWQDFITVEVNSDQIITNVEMNSIAQTAMAARRDFAQLDEYEEAFGYDFYEQANTLERSLVGLSSHELADTIRVAYPNDLVDFDTTIFANLAEQALNADPVEIGDYIDGWYQSLSDFNEDGFQYFVNLFVQHGTIIAVHWNAINEEGILKYDPTGATAVNDEMRQWHSQAQLVEESLIARQDPMLFAFDENGRSTDIPNVTIEVEPFISLATQALAAGPLIREHSED